MSDSGLRAGQVAAAAGVNQQTLRYYERRGLLSDPDRTPGGHRLYPPETVTVLRVIKAAQRLGFTLEEISGLLEAGRHHHIRKPDTGLQARAREKLVDVEAKISDLNVIAASLRTALNAGCDDLIDCAHNPTCPLPFADLAAVRADSSSRNPL
jgi:DNA-binding transcriptional MerR regulator